MRSLKGVISTFIIAAVSLPWVRCTPLSTAGGSEIGNPSSVTVAGKVVYMNSGSPAAGADVRLRSRAFWKDTTMAAVLKSASDRKNTITGGDGRFVIDSVDTGDYTIEVNDGKSNIAAIPCLARGASAVLTLPVDTLRPAASIAGQVAMEQSGASAYIQVSGLDRVARADIASGAFMLRDMPAGTFDLRVVSSSPVYQPMRINRVTVASGRNTSVDTVILRRFAGWSYSRRIILNTTAGGADVSGPVYEFPALIRLDRSSFDFSLAQPDGSDLRFATPDSMPLPFEIEQWDRSADMAAIWVRVDTIRGNDSTQSILMFWGNPAVENASNAAAVFGTDNGHIGVWHLGTACNDATGNRHDGENSGANDTPGIIGGAKRFDGSDSIRIPGLLGQPITFTLSGWAKTDTIAFSGQDIVTLGDAVLIRADEVVGGYGTGGYAHQSTRGTDTSFLKVTTGLNIAKSGWRYIAFSFDLAAQTHSLYIDGIPVRTDTSSVAVDYTGVGTNTFIGAHGNGKKSYNHRGSIDEVRVDRVARSADWIKMCYMNQRTDDRLVVMK